MGHKWLIPGPENIPRAYQATECTLDTTSLMDTINTYI